MIRSYCADFFCGYLSTCCQIVFNYTALDEFFKLWFWSGCLLLGPTKNIKNNSSCFRSRCYFGGKWSCKLPKWILAKLVKCCAPGFKQHIFSSCGTPFGLCSKCFGRRFSKCSLKISSLWWLDQWLLSYGQLIQSPTLCEDILIESGHVFQPILLINSRNVYLRLTMMYTQLGSDSINL